MLELTVQTDVLLALKAMADSKDISIYALVRTILRDYVNDNK